MSRLNGKCVLVGITAGIAAYKAADIVRRLRDAGADTRVVMTPSATQFITPLTMQALSGHPVRSEFLNADAESGMDHIELARWADIVLVAPASADFLARLNAGMADDLLSTLCLATQAPCFLAPAMNQVMWSKAATQRNIEQLKQDGYRIIPPASGEQACGETGTGRLPETQEIISQLRSDLITDTRKPSACDLNVMITAGPTWEAIDPVRGITNASSGKMGYALAQAFLNAGAEVTLVSGPCHIPPPRGAVVRNVKSAMDMYEAVHREIGAQQIFVAVAAVADYRPAAQDEQKIKKSDAELTLKLIPNPDILSSVAALEQRPFCVGFAAETQNVRGYALGKLERKRLDLIAANQVGEELGFNKDDNTLLVLGKNLEITIGPADKSRVAEQLCDLILDQYEKENSD